LVDEFKERVKAIRKRKSVSKLGGVVAKKPAPAAEPPNHPVGSEPSPGLPATSSSGLILPTSEPSSSSSGLVPPLAAPNPITDDTVLSALPPLAPVPPPRKKGNWESYKVHGCGELAYDPSTRSLNAHCHNEDHVARGAHCHCDRTLHPSKSKPASGQGRPLGFLVAWLLYKDAVTKQDHHIFKKWLATSEGRALRIVGRNYVKAHRHLHPLLEEGVERPKLAEDSEPECL
jgi:hypothetical protein